MRNYTITPLDCQRLQRMAAEIQKGTDAAERFAPPAEATTVQQAITAARADAAWLLDLRVRLERHIAEHATLQGAWQAAAQHIPLWPGCRRAEGTLVIDLEDPDTRIAYIRRLAVALGCPLDLATDGVIVDWEGPGILVCAGVPAIERRENYDPYLVYPWEIEIPNALVRTRENMPLALALAWPAETRE